MFPGGLRNSELLYLQKGSRQLNFLSIISSCMALQDREFQANGRKSKDLARGVRMWKAIVAGGEAARQESAMGPAPVHAVELCAVDKPRV